MSEKATLTESDLSVTFALSNLPSSASSSDKAGCCLLLRAVYLTNCSLGHVEKPKHLRAVSQADDQLRGAVDSLQTRVKYAECESCPCQGSAGGGGVPSHANTEHSWRGCLCLCIHESFNPGVYLQQTEVLQTAVTYSTLIRRLVKMWLIALSSCADIYLWFCLFILHLKEESTQKFKLSYYQWHLWYFKTTQHSGITNS